MTDHHDDYESYVHQHELVPKWANLVARVLTQKPTDSVATKLARFGGLVTSPVWVAAPTLAAHAHDEIMYSPVSPFLSMPGYMQYKASRALFGPKPQALTSASTIKLPPRPISFTTIPKMAPTAPRRVDVRPPPRPLPPPPRTQAVGPPGRSLLSSPHIADPSWKLRLNSTFKPPPVSTRMTLSPVRFGTSLPYRPFSTNLGLGIPKLNLRRF